MNEEWISDSHNSAELFKDRSHEYHEYHEMKIIRILDVVGLFETSWLLFDHSSNTKYGYPKQ